MKKKSIALILAVLTLAICFVFAACGDKTGGDTTTAAGDTTAAGTAETSDLAYIKDKGKLIVGMTVYEPMNYKDKETGEWTGFDTEFALAVGKELGVEIEFFEIADWDNKFIELDTKNIDCVWNGMTINEKAKLNSSVSDPYVVNAQVVVMKKDKLAQYPDEASLKDLSFAVENGSAGHDAAKELGCKTTVVKYQSDALLEVESGAVDACIIDLTMANGMTGEGTSYADLGYVVELNKEEYGISCRKGSDLTAEINRIMAEMKADGSLQKLADKYELTLVD
ncbi:MAG: transporter substrate-binding domain-containing protein [Oscillospiraceae bacterium]|nr:transporter substrate-binding domain-containing protein [Oscillospiraceae bacterium]